MARAVAPCTGCVVLVIPNASCGAHAISALLRLLLLLRRLLLLRLRLLLRLLLLRMLLLLLLQRFM